MNTIRKILVAGASGMLGTDLVSVLGERYEVVGVDQAEGDLSNPDVAEKMIAGINPDLIVNAAAYTNVDDCQNKQGYAKALRANVILPTNLASTAQAMDIPFVHFSTDYVFSGEKGDPYVETDRPMPLSAYGKSKLIADLVIQRVCWKHLILRSSWLFGKNGVNFVEKILQKAEKNELLTVVDDQIGCPTSTLELARGTRAAIEKNLLGIYNIACRDSVSWHGFAKKICEIAGHQLQVQPITTPALNLPAKRPANSSLNCTRFIRDTGHKPATWQDALTEYIKKR